MEYAEYKKIIDDGMVAYVNGGGSTYYIGCVIKEYIFEYNDDMLPHDSKKRLSDKAIQAIMKKDKLPSGIRLIKCIWHGKDR